MDREYTRYSYINTALNEVYKGLNKKLQYEAKNIIERWLLTLANDCQGDEDKIFDERKLSLTYPATLKMQSEMKEKKIPNLARKFENVIDSSLNYLALTSYPGKDIAINKDTVIVSNYSRTLPPGKLEILLQMNNSFEVLGKMIMRYASLLPGGQQWAIPIEMYKFMTQRYGVTIEGFASPINSQILYINKEFKYCSLFPDTDEPYGSLGSFFTNDFTNLNVYANPPYVENIMDRMVRKIVETCENAGKNTARFFITVPEWKDADFYANLLTSPFLVYDISFPKGKHFYVDTNNGFEKIPAYFGTHLFVIAVNVNDTYDEIATYTEKLFS